MDLGLGNWFTNGSTLSVVLREGRERSCAISWQLLRRLEAARLFDIQAWRKRATELELVPWPEGSVKPKLLLQRVVDPPLLALVVLNIDNLRVVPGLAGPSRRSGLLEAAI